MVHVDAPNQIAKAAKAVETIARELLLKCPTDLDVVTEAARKLKFHADAIGKLSTLTQPTSNDGQHGVTMSLFAELVHYRDQVPDGHKLHDEFDAFVSHMREGGVVSREGAIDLTFRMRRVGSAWVLTNQIRDIARRLAECSRGVDDPKVADRLRCFAEELSDRECQFRREQGVTT